LIYGVSIAVASVSHDTTLIIFNFQGLSPLSVDKLALKYFP
jgi:hypothetical protein